LTALCDAASNRTASEQVKRMPFEEQGQDQDPASESPAHMTQREAHWSYLLRLWRSGETGGWRASLQSIPSGERHMFADMESLLAFLVSLSR
jgi:hypothetical protein